MRTLLLCLMLVAPLTLSAALPAGASSSSPLWPAGGPSATTSHGISNGVVSVDHAFAHLRNLQFPQNNTFMEVTGGGAAYAVRHHGQVSGIFFQPIDIEGFAVKDPLTLVGRDLSYDGTVSTIARAQLHPTASAFAVTYWVKNTGNRTVPDLALYAFLEPNANGNNMETSSFDASSGVVASTNTAGASAILGTYACAAEKAHAIGDTNVLAQIANGSLNNATSYTGDSWVAHGITHGALSPGDVRQFDFVFRLAHKNGSVADAAAFCPAPGAPPVDFRVPVPKPRSDIAIVGARANVTRLAPFSATIEVDVANVGATAAPGGSAGGLLCGSSSCRSIPSVAFGALAPGETTTVVLEANALVAAGEVTYCVSAWPHGIDADPSNNGQCGHIVVGAPLLGRGVVV